MVSVYNTGLLPNFVALLFAVFSLTGDVPFQDGWQEVSGTTKRTIDLLAPQLSRMVWSCSSQPQQNNAPMQPGNGAPARQEAIQGDFVDAGLYVGGKRLLLAARNQILELWDLQTGRRMDELIGYDNDDINLTCAAITPNGTRAFLGGLKRVVVWDIAHRRLLTGWGENWGSICCMAMSADGKTLLLGQAGGYAELRSVATGLQIRVIYRSKNADIAPNALAFSLNGRYALVEEAGDITLCEVATGRTIRRFAHEPGFGGPNTRVAFSPDSNYFAATSIGSLPSNSPSISSLRFWDRRTGKLLWKLIAPAGETLHYLAFTPDGKRLVTGGDLIRVWDVTTHREIRHFPEQKGRSVYNGLLILPDGQKVISRHLDSQGEWAVELWKLATGERRPIWVKLSDRSRATMQQEGGPGVEQRARQGQSALNRQLIAALLKGDDKQALDLINQGADPDTRYEPMPNVAPPTNSNLKRKLMLPLASDSPTAFMIACGAMWDQEDSTFYAQEHRRDTTGLIEAMLKHHANVNATTHQGETALWWAVRFNRANMVSILVANHADVNAKLSNGATVLMSAVQFKVSLDVLDLLLDHGAKVNAHNDAGWTALTVAIYFPPIGDTTIVRELLSHGADPNVVDRGGNTLLTIANRANRSDIVDLLKQYGAVRPESR